MVSLSVFGIGAGGDLAGFHQHLETLEFVSRLDVRLGAEQLGNQSAHIAARRLIGNLGRDDGATIGRRIGEGHEADGVDVGALDRAPADGFVLGFAPWSGCWACG